MYTRSLSLVIALWLSFFATVFSLPSSALVKKTEKPGSCNADNCLRALRRFQDQAAPFCRLYINAPVVTSYVTTIPAPTPPPVTSPVPTFVAQYPESRISSACSCLSVGPQVTQVPVPDTSCENAGLAYAVQDHNQYNADPPSFSSANVGFFHSVAPSQTGVTNSIGFTDTSPPTIYGVPNVLGRNDRIAVNHRGYFYCPLSGVYTIKSVFADDLTLVWVGEYAFNGAYTRENANLVQGYNVAPVITTVTLTAGVYYPIRILNINAQGLTRLNVEITGPDSTVFAAFETTTRYFVQFPCNPANGDKYQDWGYET